MPLSLAIDGHRGPCGHWQRPRSECISNDRQTRAGTCRHALNAVGGVYLGQIPYLANSCADSTQAVHRQPASQPVRQSVMWCRHHRMAEYCTPCAAVAQSITSPYTTVLSNHRDTVSHLAPAPHFASRARVRPTAPQRVPRGQQMQLPVWHPISGSSRRESPKPTHSAPDQLCLWVQWVGCAAPPTRYQGQGLPPLERCRCVHPAEPQAAGGWLRRTIALHRCTRCSG
jgi:hypothetical protein